jgi:LPXTG-motif cell wall-anchored protein
MGVKRTIAAAGLATLFAVTGASSAHAVYPPSGSTGNTTTVRSNVKVVTEPELAYTGTELAQGAGIAGLLIAGGAGAVVVARRRRHHA